MGDKRNLRNLSEDLFAIWNAGVRGVAPERLIEENVGFQSDGKHTILCVHDREIPVGRINRVVIIGAGKASARMGIALQRRLLPVFGRKRIHGWVNVPEDCVLPTEGIHLHGARPAGINEPTLEGIRGTRKMLGLLDVMSPRDLCFCLISGGGSALMPAPVPQISWESKVALTRFLSDSGANINELNTVRKQLSLVKGGGLLRFCRGKRLISLILSDVPGDPLDVIASGPTVENPTTARDALNVLEKYGALQDRHGCMSAFPDILRYLAQKAQDTQKTQKAQKVQKSRAETHCDSNVPSGGGAYSEGIPVDGMSSDCDAIMWNFVIGNNALAVDCAGIEAEKRGYSHAMVSARSGEGAVETLGDRFFSLVASMFRGSPDGGGPDCLISGGEPTVSLPEPRRRGRGGRNQQLILGILVRLIREYEKSFPDFRKKTCPESSLFPLRFAILSGGTDGEDGPTDAAGAFLDETVFHRVVRKMREGDFDPEDYLRRCDAYRFFEQVGGLWKTGPTGTNVCDLRVLLVQR